MVKDKLFRGLLIPFLALTLPLASGLVDFTRLHALSILFTLAFFGLSMHLTCEGMMALQLRLRNRRFLRRRVGVKLAVLMLASLLFCLCAALAAALLWQWALLGRIEPSAALRTAALTAILMLILSLVYESVFLSAELDVDARVMEQLERERLQAELSILQNELDPHFLFNSLNALSYLVRNDADRAYEFVHKLSNVFKYLLLNKQKAFVCLHEEMAYLDDYCFLLRVRFDESIQVQKKGTTHADAQVIPCTLQSLVENAIKHNFFSDKDPLVITVSVDEEYVIVSNPVKPKPYSPASTKTGLQNLRLRYRLILQKAILVQRHNETFLVKVPLHKNAKVMPLG